MPIPPVRRSQPVKRTARASAPTVATPVRRQPAAAPQSMSKDEIIRNLKAKNDRLEAQMKLLKGVAVSMHTASTKASTIGARDVSNFSRRLLDILNGRIKA